MRRPRSWWWIALPLQRPPQRHCRAATPTCPQGLSRSMSCRPCRRSIGQRPASPESWQIRWSNQDPACYAWQGHAEDHHLATPRNRRAPCRRCLQCSWQWLEMQYSLLSSQWKSGRGNSACRAPPTSRSSLHRCQLSHSNSYCSNPWHPPRAMQCLQCSTASPNPLTPERKSFRSGTWSLFEVGRERATGTVLVSWTRLEPKGLRNYSSPTTSFLARIQKVTYSWPFPRAFDKSKFEKDIDCKTSFIDHALLCPNVNRLAWFLEQQRALR